MASHLTVITAANPGTAVKGLNAAASASAEAGTDALGAFAALLGDLTGIDTTTAPSSPAAANLAGLVGFPLDAGADSDQKPDQSPDALAAAIDAVVPIQATPDQSVLASAIDALAAVRAALENGGTPSADDLTKLNQGLDALADALGLDRAALPSMDELAAMAAQPSKAGPPGQLVTTLAPLATDLLTGATKTTDAELSAQLKATGEKLAALLKGLDDGALDPAKLAALGLDDDHAPLDADLQAAIAKLVKPPVITAEAAVAAQTFVAPKLQTSEPALTGKASADVDASAAPKSADPVTKPDPAPKSDTDHGAQSDKPKDSKLESRPNAAPAADAQNQTQNTAPAGPQAQTRIEATPMARPVIAGYQTSQQQLNLPQIAFELVRQVNDGNTRFQMRLDPPELGKIDVRLDIDKSGQVTARLTVEKAETLDLMQRDQRGLEKALQQAGLDGAKTNLEFSLKQNSSGQQGQDNGRQPFFTGPAIAEAEPVPAPAINLYRASLSASGVNIIA